MAPFRTVRVEDDSGGSAAARFLGAALRQKSPPSSRRRVVLRGKDGRVGLASRAGGGGLRSVWRDSADEASRVGFTFKSSTAAPISPGEAASKEGRAIFVRGLPSDITREELLHNFSKHGKVESLKVEPSGSFATAHVTFDSPLAAERVAKLFNGAPVERSASSLRQTASYQTSPISSPLSKEKRRGAVRATNSERLVRDQSARKDTRTIDRTPSSRTAYTLRVSVIDQQQQPGNSGQDEEDDEEDMDFQWKAQKKRGFSSMRKVSLSEPDPLSKRRALRDRSGPTRLAADSDPVSVFDRMS